jgi:hypothetical protein
MPLLILGKDVSNYVKSDPTAAALRVTLKPVETNKNYQHISAKTGALTGVAANAPVYTLQNQSSNLLIIKRVKICFTLTTAFGAAQYLDFGLIVSRNITVPATGGTLIPLTGNNANLYAASPSVSQANCRISTTGTLTTGTRTLDSNYMAIAGNWMGAIGAMIPLTMLFEAAVGKYPITLAQGEGIEIAPVTAMGATGVGVLGVTVEFAETPAY